jgi:hypothetical protein
MSDCNPCKIPMEPKIKLGKESSSALVDATLYRSLVGSLRYLVNTRPDLAFSVGFVSRFMQEPHVEQLTAVKHILRYVAGTCALGLFYAGGSDEDPVIKGYSDSDLAGNIDGRKSTTGMLCFLCNRPMSWVSAKQRVVAMSSCEAKYIASAATSCHVVWLARLMSEILNREQGTSLLMIDNKSAISVINNSIFNDRSRHINVRFHLIREYDANGHIKVQFIKTEDQLGDLLTKSLCRVKFQGLCTEVGLFEPTK